jgi:hypothetical protein
MRTFGLDLLHKLSIAVEHMLAAWARGVGGLGQCKAG